ncbi:hypothetical protein P7C73_g1043, partial [Tremellales sp. Uapishka_1]
MTSTTTTSTHDNKDGQMIIPLASPGTIFHLRQGVFKADGQPLIPKLGDIQPAFLLPLLDEHSSGRERLLASMSTGSTYAALSVKPEQGKDQKELPTSGTEKEDEEEEDRDAFWKLAAEAGPSRPLFQPLRTWDRDDSMLRTSFLSEKPTFEFDAFITTSVLHLLHPPVRPLTNLIRSSPPVALPKLKARATPPPENTLDLLHLMMRATLGTTMSSALRWDEKRRAFSWEDDTRAVGIEAVTARSSVARFLDIGTSLRRLEIIVDAQSSTPLTPTHHALLYALSTYLTFIKQRLTLAVDECIAEGKADWNKWISVTRDVGELSTVLAGLMGWPLHQSKLAPLPSRASALLTHLYTHLLTYMTTSTFAQQRGHIVLSLAYLLSQSSKPFLTLLHQWIGLSSSLNPADDDVDPASQPWADLGITRKPLPPSEGELRWEYEFSSRKMPAFIPKEDRRMLFEAGRSLRLLREASGGEHPLCEGSWGLSSSWGWGEEVKSMNGGLNTHVRRVKREIEYWRRSVRERSRPVSGASMRKLLPPPRRERKPLPLEFIQQAKPPVPEPVPAEPSPESLWAMFDRLPGSHLTTTTAATTPLWAPSPLDSLHAFIGQHSDPLHPLLPPQTPTLPLHISAQLLSPLVVHSTLVSTSLVSLYLDDLRFLDHLDVLKAFFLGGDAGFIERVSGALFGKDEAGAGEALGLGKRARTRARLGLGGVDKQEVAGSEAEEWGIGLGVGLSERASWPPGGAELAYALRTTLLADEKADQERGPVWEDIEDRVSFAVRNLPDDAAGGKRARWLNPQAIEALDFLYLSYSPPISISALLPPTLMEKYQSINNLLLRLSRTHKVVQTMYWDILHPTFVSRQSLPRGDGIATPEPSVFRKGSQLEKMLLKIRFRMAFFVTVLSRYVVDRAIGSNWDMMRKRLEKLKARPPGRDESRPSTPGIFEYDMLDNNEDDDEETSSVHQLQSVHSLVVYHHVILDRILRACLLSSHQGHEVTFKILMGLLGLVLDLGKLVKEIQRGLVIDGEERVRALAGDWDEKDKIFMQALERLSLRTASKANTETGEDGEEDLKMLLQDPEGDQVVTSDGGGSSELQDLLIRLKLGGESKVRRGRWNEEV